MFIADEMYVHRYNNFYLETNCGVCTSTSPKELEVNVTNPIQTNEAVVKNYPNPFSAKTNIVFILPQNDKVRLEVYDLSGKLIQTLFNGSVNENQEYKVEFDGSALSNGIYIYKMTTNGVVFTGKMILNKE
jgi:myo-inositol-hexaphosphate 3-phosphohydrolase